MRDFSRKLASVRSGNNPGSLWDRSSFPPPVVLLAVLQTPDFRPVEFCAAVTAVCVSPLVFPTEASVKLSAIIGSSPRKANVYQTASPPGNLFQRQCCSHFRLVSESLIFLFLLNISQNSYKLALTQASELLQQ